MKAIPQKPVNYIRALAIAFKIIVSLEAILIASDFISELIVEMRSHALTDPIFVFIVLFLALLVVVPNRWIVRSPVVYQICLVLTSMPAILALIDICSRIVVSKFTWNDCFGMVVIMVFFLPWPLSLLFSRICFVRGESFWYA
jgi:hypothetical protein